MINASRAVAVILALVLGVSGYVAYQRAGRVAPDAPYVRLDGSRGSIHEMKGRVVLVNFWATDCAVCLQEMPSLVAVHEKFKARGYDTLAVSMRYDPPANVIRYAEERRLPFAVAIDNTGQIARSFAPVDGTPTSVLIDKHGRIAERFVGQPDVAALERLIDKLLTAT